MSRMCEINDKVHFKAFLDLNPQSPWGSSRVIAEHDQWSPVADWIYSIAVGSTTSGDFRKKTHQILSLMLKEVIKYIHIISCHLKPLLVLSVDSLLLTPIMPITPKCHLQTCDDSWDMKSPVKKDLRKKGLWCNALVLWVSVSKVWFHGLFALLPDCARSSRESIMVRVG